MSSLKLEKFIFHDVLNNLKFTEMSDVTMTYISLKSQKLWENELEKIDERFSMFKTDPMNNSLFIAYKIKEEFEKICSPFDLNFNSKCTEILSKKSLIDDPNREFIATQLRESAFQHLTRASKMQGYLFVKKEVREKIIESHILFLKNEYYEIVKYYSNSIKNCDFYYQNYIDLLNEQIKFDINEVNKFVNEVNKEIIKIDEIKDLDDHNLELTNYEIRVKEKQRQLECIVQMDQDLRDIIE